VTGAAALLGALVPGATHQTPLWLGSVTSVGSIEAEVLIDGAETPVTAIKGVAGAAVGNRVIITRIGLSLYVLVNLSTSGGGGGGSGIVESIVEGYGANVDSSDPAHPIISVEPYLSNFFLDPGSLHPLYGDHFEGAGLDARWSRHGAYAAIDEDYQSGGGSWMVTSSRASGSFYSQPGPGGDFSLVMAATHLVQTGTMFGLMAVDNTGAGVGGGWYNQAPNSSITAQLNTASNYDGAHFTTQTSTTQGPQGALIAALGCRTWYRLSKVGDDWTTRLSMNGMIWSPPTSPLTFTGFVPTKIGFGTFFGGAVVGEGMAIDFFDVQ
jgi:hypothetical protein